MAITKKGMRRIRRGLWSRSRRKRLMMLDYVRAMSHEDAVEVIANLFASDRMAQEMASVRGILALALVGIPVIIMEFWLASYWMLWNSPLVPALLIVSILSIRRFALNQQKTFPRAACALLGWTKDKAFVAPYLQSLKYGDAFSRMPLENALADSLPLLDGAELNSLTVEQRGQVVKLLSSNNPRAQEAAVDAFRRCDAVSLIPQIERLLHRKSDKYVMKAAELCLERLYEVREAQKASATLLRASKRDESNSALLRTSAPSTDNEGVQLLRPNYE